jgi:hypothetical protein
VKVPRQRIRSNAGSPVSFTTLGVRVSVHAAALRANMPVVYTTSLVRACAVIAASARA